MNIGKRQKISKVRKWWIHKKWQSNKATLEEFKAAGGLSEMLRMSKIKPCRPGEGTKHIYRAGPMGFSLWVK